MRYILFCFLLIIISVTHYGCSLPTNSFKNQYIGTSTRYMYNENGSVHNYSDNWDFDGDGINDLLLFIGKGGAHLYYYPIVGVSSMDTIFSFSCLLVENPFYEGGERSEISVISGFSVEQIGERTELIITANRIGRDETKTDIVKLRYNEKNKQFDIYPMPNK